MGDKSPDEPKSSKIAAEIQRDLYNRTSGIRTNVLDELTNASMGGWNPSESPMWGPARGVIEDQYGVAKDNIMANLPKGGQLNEGLMDLDTSRARSLGDLAGQIGSDYWNKSYGLASGVPQQASSTLGMLGSQQMQAEAQATAGKAGMMGDLGLAAAMFLI